jgi:hypothetical protein
MTYNENIERALSHLNELRSIYHDEGGGRFVVGISAPIRYLGDQSLAEEERWSNARSRYKTMAGSKSGFTDVYMEKPTIEQILVANQRLDYLRGEHWRIFGGYRVYQCAFNDLSRKCSP